MPIACCQCGESPFDLINVLDPFLVIFAAINIVNLNLPPFLALVRQQENHKNVL